MQSCLARVRRRADDTVEKRGLPCGPECTCYKSKHAHNVSSRRVVQVELLVVDDEADVADALASLLRSFGHSVHTAYSPDAAVDIARATALDVALVDLTLRDAHGADLARMLRAECANSRLHVVACSGHGADPLLTRAFDDYIEKPPELSALIRVLENVRPHV